MTKVTNVVPNLRINYSAALIYNIFGLAYKVRARRQCKHCKEYAQHIIKIIFIILYFETVTCKIECGFFSYSAGVQCTLGRNKNFLCQELNYKKRLKGITLALRSFTH